uniref:F-box domain-containing protein n=1 Tax=Brugia timori TaxID=42155 RepID=A0A0R3QXU4_9BILA
LCEPTITLSVARDKPTDPKIDPEKKNGTEKKTERELTTHVEFIYGQNSMMRVEVPGTEGTWQQPKIKLWPRSRKHRRDKLVIRHQAQMIEELFLHGPSDLKNSAVGCSDEKLEASLENMPQKVLIKIFEFIAKEQNNNPNISVYNMYRLKLVCRRFNDVLENNTKVLPRYEVCGLRIQSKKVGPLGYFAMVYRYGTGAFEPPCACLDLTDIPSFLRHDIINGFIYIDKMELTDRLFITLNELTYAENVQKIVFSKISSVNLTPESGICTFLDKFPNLLDLWFFGYYEESELGLDHSQVVMQMQRSERGNGILTRKDMESMIERLKYKRKKRIKRSGMRAAVQNKARVQKKEAIQSKTRYIQNKTGNRNKAGDQSKTRVQSKIEVQSKERTQSKTRIRNETEIQSKTTGKSNPQKKNA